MKTTRQQPTANREGFALVASVLVLAVASATIGYALTAAMTYRRNADTNHNRERAAFLADAGLQAAVVDLRDRAALLTVAELPMSPAGSISYAQSRAYFSQTNQFTASNWGFLVQRGGTNGATVLISTGRYGSSTVQVRAEVEREGGDSIHSLYRHAMFAGVSSGTNYVMQVGGTGSSADFVNGDTYSGDDLVLSGSALLRLPEALATDLGRPGIYDPGTDTWHNAYAVQVFTNPLSLTAFNTYSNSMVGNMSKVYNNRKYDFGEAFVDTIGNGVYDPGEPFVDSNGNGVRDLGDSFIDRNGNGVYNAGVDTVVDRGNGRYDAGEEWTEDSVRRYNNQPNGTKVRVNGKYDRAGGYYSGSTWKTPSWAASWPAEAYEDVGDGLYSPAESFTDRNGIYDQGERYLDDRNSVYDYGTRASGTLTGMPAPGPGQRPATGGCPVISPPNLLRMYYQASKTGSPPSTNALLRWGHDVAVTASRFSANGHVVADPSDPVHIFVRNVRQSDPGQPNGQYEDQYAGVWVKSRGYNLVYNNLGQRVDDYFLEDPTDATYNTIPGESLAIALNDNNRTHTMLITVRPEHNEKLYYVEGNVYLHATPTYALRFRNPNTRITIVARGNITISDEFYYNAQYPANLQYSAMNSKVVYNPSDALCLIAIVNPICANSGNIYIGDPAMNTGGSIHAMLYAEKDFIDSNINTVDQQFISVFGNMTAGDEVRINRVVGGGKYRTRLDVTLDERIRDAALAGRTIVPGLPHPEGNQDAIPFVSAWQMKPNSWFSWSMLE